MLLKRTVAPAASPVTTAELKQHIRVSFDDDDLVLEGYLASAAAAVEEMTGRALMLQSWQVQYPAGAECLLLGRTPVVSLTSIAYFDSTDQAQALSVSDFYLLEDTGRAWVQPKASFAWPVMMTRPDALTITFQAGYSAVPAPLKSAVLMMAGHLYENREATGGRMEELPLGVRDLVGLHRVGWIA